MMPIHHLAFRTSDVATLAAFYRDLFGLEIVRDALPRSVWLAIGAGCVLMIELKDPGEPSPAAASMDLVAFAGDEPTKEEVGAKARQRDCYDGQTEFPLYLRDPDGRRVGVSTFDLHRA